MVGKNNSGTMANLYFLKIAGGTNAGLTAVGGGTVASLCGKFVGIDGTLTAENETPHKGNPLIAALVEVERLYNLDLFQPDAPRALPWFSVKNDYPNLILSVTIDDTGKNIYANGLAITLKAVSATYSNLTNIYDKKGNLIDLANVAGSKLTATNGGYDLATYTVYGGGREGVAAGDGVVAVTGNTSITMEGGKVKNIYGGGKGSAATVSGTKTVTINGNPTIGTNNTSDGIIINNSETDDTMNKVINGVDLYSVGAHTNAKSFVDSSWRRRIGFEHDI